MRSYLDFSGHGSRFIINKLTSPSLLIISPFINLSIIALFLPTLPTITPSPTLGNAVLHPHLCFPRGSCRLPPCQCHRLHSPPLGPLGWPVPSRLVFAPFLFLPLVVGLCYLSALFPALTLTIAPGPTEPQTSAPALQSSSSALISSPCGIDFFFDGGNGPFTLQGCGGAGLSLERTQGFDSNCVFEPKLVACSDGAVVGVDGR